MRVFSKNIKDPLLQQKEPQYLPVTVETIPCPDTTTFGSKSEDDSAFGDCALASDPSVYFLSITEVSFSCIEKIRPKIWKPTHHMIESGLIVDTPGLYTFGHKERIAVVQNRVIAEMPNSTLPYWPFLKKHNEDFIDIEPHVLPFNISRIAVSMAIYADINNIDKDMKSYSVIEYEYSAPVISPLNPQLPLPLLLPVLLRYVVKARYRLNIPITDQEIQDDPSSLEYKRSRQMPNITYGINNEHYQSLYAMGAPHASANISSLITKKSLDQRDHTDQMYHSAPNTTILSKKRRLRFPSCFKYHQPISKPNMLPPLKSPLPTKPLRPRVINLGTQFIDDSRHSRTGLSSDKTSKSNSDKSPSPSHLFSADDVSIPPNSQKTDFFRCPEENCPKIYPTKKSLRQHQKDNHSGERYECESCQKQFSRFFSLDRHRKSHEVRRKPMCRKCGKEFTRGYNTENHAKRCQK